MPEANYKDIITKIAEHDDLESFKVLVNSFSMQLRAYAFTYIKRQELAEEIVSDVWLKIWNNREQLPHIMNLSSYLYVATKNQSLTYQSRLNKKNEHFSTSALDDIPETSADTLTPLQVVENQELKIMTDKVIAQLPPVGRAAFKLVREEGKSYKEAAEELNISVNTLKTHLRRAIQKLRIHFSKHIHSIFFL